MDYGDVLRRTWQITWRYKGLWVLGLLAGCGTGGGGSNTGWQASGGGGQLEQAVMSIPGWIWVVFAILMLLLIVLVVVLGVIGTGGLIAGFRQADLGEDVSLGQAFRKGAKYFWRLLGFRVLLLLLGIVFAAVVVVASIGSLGLCIIPLLCIGIPLAFLVSTYVSLAQVSLIDDDQRTLDAFRRGWELLRAHPGAILLMGLILVGGGLVIGLALATPILLIMLPFFAGLGSETQAGMTAGMLVSGLCFLGFLPILLLVNAVVQTFVTGAWTLTYRRLTGKLAGTSPAPEVVLPSPG